MKKETVLFVVAALLAGFLGGYLIFSINKAGKEGQETLSVSNGGGVKVDYAQRIVEAEKVINQDPKNINAWITLGNDYFDTEQYQKAINAYAKALEINPDNPSVLTDQGVMYRKVGSYDKAIANFEKAQKLDPKHLQSLYNLGIVYTADLKQPDKAAVIWKKYLQMDPNSPAADQIRSMMQQTGSGGASPFSR